MLPRLRPGGKICTISTRWREDDLFSRLAAIGRYEVVSLPAVAEQDDPLGRAPGEYLWDSDPEYPYGDFLRAQREAQIPFNWSALFQSRPAPEEGVSEWFKPMTAMPARERIAVYGASDFARRRPLRTTCFIVKDKNRRRPLRRARLVRDRY